MQLHHLDAFLALAHDLNFRRAAARLCISQPALSAQIVELEHDLGVILFARDRSGTRLTPDGLALVPVARSAVAAVAEVELAAHHDPRRRRRFTAGVMPDGVGELTWPLFRTFHDARPDLQLHVTSVGFANALPLLRSSTIDVLLAIGPFGEEDGDITTVGSMPVAAILPSWHPRGDSAAVELEWLGAHLSLSPPEGMGRGFAEFWTLQDVGAPPPDRLRSMDPGQGVGKLLELVSLGAVGPWPAKLPAAGRVSIRPIMPGRVALLQIVAAHRPHPDVRQFCRIARTLARAASTTADHEL